MQSSVERFYLSPMVHSARVLRGNAGAGAATGAAAAAQHLCRSDEAGTTERTESSSEDGDDGDSAFRRRLAAAAAVASDDDESGFELSLEFVTTDSIKSNFPQGGSWRLEAAASSDDEAVVVVARGDLTFDPHWRPKTVTALLSNVTESLLSVGSWRLVVQDQWRFHSRVIPLSCADASGAGL